MEGVKILNEISPMTAGVWVSIGYFVFIGVGFLIWILVGSDIDKKGKFILILIDLLPFLFATILFFSEYKSPMKYEVIIDDNVKLTEFEEKYEIVERRGNIYVVEECEND